MSKGIGGVGSILGDGFNCHEGMCCPITNPTCAGINPKTGVVPMYPPGSGPRTWLHPPVARPLPVVSQAGSPAAAAQPNYVLWAVVAVVVLLFFGK